MLVLVTVVLATLLSASSASTVAVIVAHDRSSLLRKTLRSLASASQSTRIPVFVSIDDNPKAHRVIRAAESEPNSADIWQQPAPPADLSTRGKIALHYYRALSKAFSNTSTQHVIVLEDDLQVSPDFLTFINATLPYLKSTEPGSLVCASGWNDNGFSEAPAHETVFTSFFPGLGWALHRSLWEKLAPVWPSSSPSAPIVGIGWDFWLRLVFDERNWSCVTPRLPRVKHVGAGSNVNAGETRVYEKMQLAKQEADWTELRLNVEAEEQHVQTWLAEGRVVSSVDEAVRLGHERPVLPYFREEYEKLSLRLRLWPTPRGHFRHTLKVAIEGTEILLYDARRAGPYWRLPKQEFSSVELVQGAINSSCDEACAGHALRCDYHALEVGNKCETLKKSFGCQSCAHETGVDLPAFVVREAPLETAGWCLVVERGLGLGGRLVCEGRFRWTRRMCGCVKSESRQTEAIHDEL